MITRIAILVFVFAGAILGNDDAGHIFELNTTDDWYYNIETSEDCILLHIDADTYFTSIYNYYRN